MKRAGQLLKRILVWSVRLLVFLLVLGLLVADLLLIAVEFPTPQKLVLTEINRVLEKQFQGQLRIESVRDMDLGGVRGARLRVFDAASKQVLFAEGVDVQADVTGLLNSLLRKRGPLQIRIRRVAIEHSETLLEIDRTGALTLARAFLPRNQRVSTGPGRSVELSIDEIAIRHAWAHGKLGSVLVDADLRAVEAALRLDDSGFSLTKLRSQLEARALPRGANPNGNLEGVLSTAPGRQLEAEASFHGRIASVAAAIQAAFSGERFSASVALPGADPVAIREIVPELPLEQRVSGIATASGSLWEFDASSELMVGQTKLAANARVKLRPRLEVVGRADARNFDLRALSSDFPALAGHATGELSYLASDGAPETRFRVEATELVLDRTKLPPSVMSGVLVGSRLSGRVSTAGGNYLDVHSDDLFGPRKLVVEGQGHLELASLRRIVPAAPRDLAGRGDFQTTAELDKQTKRYWVGFTGRFTGVRVAGNTAESATLSGGISGGKGAPDLDLSARLQRVQTNGERLAAADVDLEGRLDHARLRVSARDDRARDLYLTATLDAPRATLRDAKARLSGHGVELQASARRVRLGGGGVEVDQLELQGAGDLGLSVESRRGRLELKASGRDIDLTRIARLLELDPTKFKGRASFDLELERRGSKIDGRLQASFVDASFSGIGPLNGAVNLTAKEGRVDGDAAIKLEDVLDARVRLVDVHLPERFPPTSLRAVRGELEAQAHVDLGRVPSTLRHELNLARAGGTADLELHFERKLAHDPLTGQLQASTKGLELLARESQALVKDRVEAIEKKGFRLVGIDFSVDARFDGKKSASSLLARALDKSGTLASLEADAPLTVEQLLEPDSLENPWQTPVHLRLTVPRRSLEQLPPMLRPPALVGQVELEAELAGNAADPQLYFVARGYGLGQKDSSRRLPLDAVAQGRYLQKHAELSVDATSQGRQILQARAWGDGALSDVLQGRGFVASARARLDGAPLELIPPLKRRQVAGLASGVITIDDLGRDAALEADLSAHHLTLGVQDCRSATLQVAAKNGRLMANAELNQPDGFLHGQADAKIAWGDRLLFEVDDQSPVNARIQANRFRAGALLPFVHHTFSELDGVVDANLEAKLARGGRSSIVGQAQLRRGVVQIPAIGQQFRRIRAKLSAAPGGVVKVDDVSARALSGRVRASASARFDGLTLSTAQARVRIAKGEEIPVTVQGVMLGEAWGGVDASLRSLPDGRTTEVKVKVPELGFELPETEKSKLQELDAAPHIRIGARLPAREFRVLPLQPLEEPKEVDGKRLVVEVELGDKVAIRRGNKLAIYLKGRLLLDIQQKALATGQIQLARGMIDVEGKRFEIDQGVINFKQDDPSNPLVVVTARWDSPDGYRLYADYRGRLQSGKLTLRSEPPLSNDQILSMLLFGSPDGSLGSDQGTGDAALALGVAGGAATQGVNRALSNLTELDLTTRIDTSHGSARPELVLQLSRRLSAAVEYAVGEPTPGQSPDRTFLTLDLRLGTHWSLASTVGDRGATLLDLLWRHRY